MGEELHRSSENTVTTAWVKSYRAAEERRAEYLQKALTATQVKVLKVLCSIGKVHMGPGMDVDR